jgi:hypothetical protein
MRSINLLVNVTPQYAFYTGEGVHDFKKSIGIGHDLFIEPSAAYIHWMVMQTYQGVQTL